MAKYTVAVAEKFTERWQKAARHFGYVNVPAWLYALAQEKVKEVGDDLPERPLVWKKSGFDVRRHADSSEIRRVSGLLAGPFGIYRGYKGEQDTGYNCFTLVHVPSATPNISLKRLKDYKELARKLYSLKLRWEATDPVKVTGSGLFEAQWLIRIYTTRHGA